MTAEHRIESPTRFEALVEDLQQQIGALAEGHLGHTEHLARTEAAFEQRFKTVEHQIIELDVRTNAKLDLLDKKIDALDQKFEKRFDALDQKFDALEQKVDMLDAKIDALDKKLSGEIARISVELSRVSTELARIAAHLGVHGAPPG